MRVNCCFKILLFFFYFSFSLVAQESILDRSKPPAIDSPKIYVPSDYNRIRIENGLDVLYMKNSSQPTVSLVFTVRGGSYYDSEKSGLANLLAELITKGTKTKNAKQIAEDLDYLGTDFSYEATRDAIFIRISILKKYWQNALAIISDCILNPEFPMSEVKNAIKRKVDEIRSLKDDPGYTSNIKFFEVLYGSHPYSKPVNGYENTVGKIIRKDLLDYHQKYFIPNNAFIVVIGDLEQDEVLNTIKEKFGQWKAGKNLTKDRVKVNNIKKSGVYLINRPDSYQSSLRVGCIGIDKNDPDLFPLTFINTYFGGYFRSALNLNLREKNSYTYGAFSYLDTKKDPGPFLISTEVGTEITAKAIDEIMYELDQVSIKPISDERLNEVKNFVIGSFPLQLQSNMQKAEFIANLTLYEQPKEKYSEYFNYVRNISETELMQISKKYLNSKNMTIVISGDRKSIEKDLLKFGKIEVFNKDGKKIK